MNRRQFNRAAALASLIAAARASGHDGKAVTPAQASTAVPGHKPATTTRAAEAQHMEVMKKYAHLTEGPKLTIAMLAYPGMFPLDLVGPLAVFDALVNRDIHIVAKTLDPVRGDKPDEPALIPIHPTTTLKDCPEVVDVLFVPGGGSGTLAMMEDQEVLSFLRSRGQRARYVTSVCTGSLILGAAGLLDGYRASSYWATLDALKHLGAIPTRGLVVTDRNRITAGGVTAGIYFALTLVSLLRTPLYAQAVQLLLEYDPAPPFNAGSPDKAPPLVREFVAEMFTGFNETIQSIGAKASRKRR